MSHHDDCIRLKLAEQERVRNRQRVLGFKEKINEIESENKALKEEIDQLRGKQDRLDALRSIIVKKDAIITRSKEDAAAITEELNQLRGSAQRQQQEHERRRRELENDLASLRRSIVDLEKENSLLRIRVGTQSQAMIAMNVPPSVSEPSQSKAREQAAAAVSSIPLPEVLSSSAQDINELMHALGKTSPLQSPSSGGESPNPESLSVEQRLKALVRAALDTKS
jgi:chromosome segregation ATPase